MSATAKDITESIDKHPGGRPTKYCPEIITKTIDYLTNYKDYGDVIPQLAGLAHHLNITRETVNKWLNDKNKKEFSDICRKVLGAQERALVNGGLESRYNSNITKMMLSKHGYTDSQDKQGVSVNVTINRGSTEIEVQGQTLEIDNE